MSPARVARLARRGAKLAVVAVLALVGCSSTPAPTAPPSPAVPSVLQPTPPPALSQAPFSAPALDAYVRALMARAQVAGLGLALIRSGQVVHQQSWGVADASTGRALQPDTVVYGASLTKAAFAHLVLQLVDDGTLDLDAPMPVLLKQPLPSYPGFAELADDPHWQQLTLRMLLSHSSGLLNWRWINPDRRLDFKFAPGSRYVYSGEGLQIAQLVVEERTGQPLAALMQSRVFDRFGMASTSMVWQPAWEPRAAVGHRTDGSVVPARRSSRARAAGSMNTTLPDYAAFLAGVLRGEGLSPALQREMLRVQIAIDSPQQFPSHFGGSTDVNRPIGLGAGLGWISYQSPHGPAFFKEGSDDGTNNFALGFSTTGDGLVLLANSANGDKVFFALAEALFRPTCLPWFWMGYIPDDQAQLRRPEARQTPVGPGAQCGVGQGAAAR
jgi:CubicO group peptidase (beta-lactamase class C family)